MKFLPLLLFCVSLASSQPLLFKMKKGYEPKELNLHGKSVHKIFKAKDKNHPVNRWYRIDADDSTFSKIKHHKWVESVTVDRIMTSQVIPNDSLYSQQWALPKISAPLAWDISTGSDTVKVADLDTPFDLTHPDLNYDTANGYNFDQDNKNLQCVNAFHGTGTSSIMGGRGNNRMGTSGVNWNLKIIPIVVLNDAGSGYMTNVGRGIVYAADLGCVASNLSLGGSGAMNDPFMLDCISYSVARGCQPVTALGNSHTLGDKFVPANTDGAATTSATDSSDNLASFSNFGEITGVAGPGVAIIEALPGSTWGNLSGTSMAAPHVTGAIALIKSVCPWLTGPEIWQAICAGADDLGPAGKDDSYGYGRLNIYRALRIAQRGVLVPHLNLASGDTISGIYHLTGGIYGGTQCVGWTIEYGKNGSWSTLVSDGGDSVDTYINTNAIASQFTNIRLIARDTGGASFYCERYNISVLNVILSIDFPINLASSPSVSVRGRVKPLDGAVVSSYTLEYAGITAPTTWAQIYSGPLPTGDVLGTWNTSGLPDGSIWTLRLRTDNGVMKTRTVKIDTMLLPDYPKVVDDVPSYQGVYSPYKSWPVIYGDMDGDGKEDEIWAAGRNVWFNGKLIYTCSQLEGITVIANKIVVNAIDSSYQYWPKIRVLNLDGSQVNWTPQESELGTLAIYDCDHDGQEEIIWARPSDQKVCAMNLKGVMAPGFPTVDWNANCAPSSYRYAPWPICMAYQDRIVYVSGFRDVKCINTKGEFQWQYRLDSLGGTWGVGNSPTLGAIGGVQVPAIFSSSNQTGCSGCAGQVTVAFFSSGRIAQKLIIPNHYGMSLNDVSATNDFAYLLYQNGTKTVMGVYDSTGLVDTLPSPLGDVGTSPICIFDAGGKRHLLWNQFSGGIACMNLDGSTYFTRVTASPANPFGISFTSYPMSVGQKTFSAVTPPQVVLSGSSGYMEMTQSYLYKWKLPDSVTATWPMYKRDPQNTGFLNAVLDTTVKHDTIPTPIDTLTAPGFVPSTWTLNFGAVPIGKTRTITFSVADTGQQPLSIATITAPIGFSIKPIGPVIVPQWPPSKFFDVTFSPIGPLPKGKFPTKQYSGWIVFTDNATGSPHKILVTGTGIKK